MSGKIIDLRKLLAERFPHPPSAARTSLITGFDSLDQAGHGGLPKSAITELISPRISAGSASVLHRLIEAAQRDQYFVALIDGRDSFDPSASAGLDNASLRHLLWVRCSKGLEAIKTADLLLRDGNFPLLIVDLVLNPVEELLKIPQTSWYRLQRLVEATSTACLILSRQSIVSSARLKIILENSWSLAALDNEIATPPFRFSCSTVAFEIRNQKSEIR